jgi:multisubunit Na+/H+ antiporter MnhC subunit
MPTSEHDPSASTAQFRAFANERSGDSAPWTMRAPRNRIVVLTAAVVGVALVLFVIALLVLG